MKNKIIISFTIAFLSITAGYAQNQNTNSNHMQKNKKGSSMMGTDQQFVTEAAKAGEKEVDMGNMGKNKATSQRVKNFSTMMVTDHTKANNELKSLVTDKKMTMPTEMKMDNGMLNNKTGADFDKSFMDMMVMDHKKAVDLFQNESKNGSDSDLKNFASKTLPTLKMHLDSAMSIQSSLKNGNKAQMMGK